MSDTSSEERDVVEIGKALIDYYEKYAKNDDLVDSFVGLDLEQRNQLRNKRSESKCKCSSTAGSNEEIETVEIFAKQLSNEIEVEVYETSSNGNNACSATVGHGGDDDDDDNEESIKSTGGDQQSKPLEWDYGADIGYNQKFKSFSMPSLETNLPSQQRQPSIPVRSHPIPSNYEEKYYFDYFNRPISHRSETANQIGRKLNELINERRAAAAAATRQRQKTESKVDKVTQPEPEHVNVAVQTYRSELLQKKLEQRAYGEEVKLYLDLIHELMKKCDRQTKKQLAKYLRESIDKWYSSKDSTTTTTTTTNPSTNTTASNSGHGNGNGGGSCKRGCSNGAGMGETKKSTTIYKLVTENCYSQCSKAKDQKPASTSENISKQPPPYPSATTTKCQCCCRRKKVEVKTVSESRKKPSIAYTMTFPVKQPPKTTTAAPTSADSNIPKPSMAVAYDLQEYLIKNRPDFVERTERRRQQLFELQTLREQRKQLQIRDPERYLIKSRGGSENQQHPTNRNCDNCSQCFKENFEGFRTREIRLQARNNFNRFDDDVRKKRESERKSQARKTYRIMSQVFRKMLAHCKVLEQQEIFKQQPGRE